MAIQITKNAWQKISEVCVKTKNPAFLFSASSGGCNGFNYIFNPITHQEIKEITSPNLKNSDKSGKFGINIIKNEDNKFLVIVDPVVEMYLFGTRIDYQEEDYMNKIFESKFLFNVDKKFASSCGCGTSFMPIDM